MNEPTLTEDDARSQHLLWKFTEVTEDHCILIMDAQNAVLWANAGASEILGASNLPGLWFGEFFTGEDIATGILQHELDVSQQTGSAMDDGWMQRKDDSRFWASGMTPYLGVDEGISNYLKIFRDLTARECNSKQCGSALWRRLSARAA